MIQVGSNETCSNTAKLMKDMGLPTPASTYKSFMVMGNTFDPGKPEEYVQSVAIKRV